MRRVSEIKQIVMPVKAEGVFIAPNANVMGDVKIGAGSSVWYGAVLRGKRMTRVLGEGRKRSRCAWRMQRAMCARGWVHGFLWIPAIDVPCDEMPLMSITMYVMLHS